MVYPDVDPPSYSIPISVHLVFFITLCSCSLTYRLIIHVDLHIHIFRIEDAPVKDVHSLQSMKQHSSSPSIDHIVFDIYSYIYEPIYIYACIEININEYLVSLFR